MSHRILNQEEIKEIIAKQLHVSENNVILYSEITTSGSIIKCAIIKEKNNE